MSAQLLRSSAFIFAVCFCVSMGWLTSFVFASTPYCDDTCREKQYFHAAANNQYYAYYYPSCLDCVNGRCYDFAPGTGTCSQDIGGNSVTLFTDGLDVCVPGGPLNVGEAGGLSGYIYGPNFALCKFCE